MEIHQPTSQDEDTVTGSGVPGQVAFWNGTNTITGDTGFTYVEATNALTVAGDITGNDIITNDGYVFKSLGAAYLRANGTSSINIGDLGVQNVLLANGGGRVGIGTTDPSGILEIGNSLNDRITFTNTLGDDSAIQIRNDGAKGFRLFSGSSYSENHKIEFYIGGTASSLVPLILANNGDVYMTEGNVGIGTPSPTTLLHVYGPLTGGYISKFESTDNDNFNTFISAAGSAEYGIYQDALYFQALDSLTGGIQFIPNSAGSTATRTIILPNGKVGIGMSPTDKLSVKGTTDGAGANVFGTYNSSGDEKFSIRDDGSILLHSVNTADTVQLRMADGTFILWGGAPTISTFTAEMTTNGFMGVSWNGLRAIGFKPLTLNSDYMLTTGSDIVLYIDPEHGYTQNKPLVLGASSTSETTHVVELGENTKLRSGKSFTWTTGIINTSGDVGIGTAAPAANLEVSDSNAGAAGGRILISNSAGRNVGQTAELLFSVTNDFVSGYFSGKIASVFTDYLSLNSADLAFFTYADGGSPEGEERLRIASTGNVGIGTVLPTARLDSVGNATYAAGLFSNSFNQNSLSVSGNGNADTVVVSSNGYNAGAINVTKATGSATSNNNNAGLLVTGTYTHNGAFGLGRGLDVTVTNNTGSSNTLYGAIISATANTAGATVVGISVDVASTSGTKYAALFGGGNVGIGTTTPDTLLSVSSSVGDYFKVASEGTGNGDVRIGRSATTGYNTIGFYTNATRDYYISQYPDSDGTFRITRHSTNNDLVLKDGDVGIGTTSPDTKLDVAGEISALDSIFINNGSGVGGTSTPPFGTIEQSATTLTMKAYDASTNNYLQLRGTIAYAAGSNNSATLKGERGVLLQSGTISESGASSWNAVTTNTGAATFSGGSSGNYTAVLVDIPAGTFSGSGVYKLYDFVYNNVSKFSIGIDGTVASSTYFIASVGNALTATGTTRTDALQLAKQVNNVTTAAAGTGVILPVGVVGMRITIFNAGANPIQVYASASETIDTVAGATGVPLTNALRCEFFYVAANTWISAQMGGISS